MADATLARRDAVPRLWAEFLGLYVGLPLLMALALPPAWLWPVLGGVTLVALALLAATPGFRWRTLTAGRVSWGQLAFVALVTGLVCTLLVFWLLPGRFLALPRRSTELWLAIMALYPFLSALPQEVVFRALFFERYGTLFPNRTVLVFVNGLAFAVAHLMFWNWVALTLCFAGGMIFALGYLRQGFAQAALLHAAAGMVVFTTGLGTYFFHGAVG